MGATNQKKNGTTNNYPFVLVCVEVFTRCNVLIPNTGEKKLGKVITPDPWKSGARNTTGKNGQTKLHVCWFWLFVNI